MRIITVNVNGIRAAAKKGFFQWMVRQQADVVCIQETRAQAQQLEDKVFHPRGWHVYFHDAEKKGYSGVAIYSKHKPNKVNIGLGWPDMDAEGRYIEACFGPLSVVSVYLPSGSSSEDRQAVKFSFLERFMPWLRKLKMQRREYILCGDWNIAHKEIDLKNWRGNRKNSGFLPEERAWMDELFGAAGFCRCLSCGQSGCRSIHLVVKPGSGMGEKCWLAYRLSDYHAGYWREGTGCAYLQDQTLFGSRTVDHGLRLHDAGMNESRTAWLLFNEFEIDNRHFREHHQAVFKTGVIKTSIG